MNISYYDSKMTVYSEHIIAQLYKKIFSDANFDISLKCLFHPEKKYKFKDVIHDNIYFQSISTLVEKDLDYYLKNLKIIVNEDDFEIIDLEYDYYNINENILNTDIKINFA